jgi:hypothetical protein
LCVGFVHGIVAFTLWLIAVVLGWRWR